MATKNELIGSGLPALVAQAIGSDIATGLSGAGTTQTDATPLTASISLFTTVGASSGARLPPAGGQPIFAIYNGGSNALAVYPSTGQQINAVTADSSVSVTNAKTGIFIPVGNRWFFMLGA